MNGHLRALAILALATAASGPASGAPPLAPETKETTTVVDALVGRWTGSAVLTDTGGATACRYEGSSSLPAVTVDIQRSADTWRVHVMMNLPATGACPALKQNGEASGVVATGRRISFVGPEGHSWTLARRQDSLQGIVASGNGSGAVRLDGEVVMTVAAPAPERPSARVERKGGLSGKAVGAFIGANIVAGAALVGVNQLGKATPEGGKTTCSPRDCAIPGLGEPCICNTTSTMGGECGTTATGIGYLGACNVQAGLPCEASLTCAGGVCDARDGACPW